MKTKSKTTTKKPIQSNKLSQEKPKENTQKNSGEIKLDNVGNNIHNVLINMLFAEKLKDLLLRTNKELIVAKKEIIKLKIQLAKYKKPTKK
jgi:hypothetical protein